MLWVALRNELHFPQFEIKLRLLIPKRQWSLSLARRFRPPGKFFRPPSIVPLRHSTTGAGAGGGSEHLTTAPEGKVWGFAAIRASAPAATPHDEFSLLTAAVQLDGRP